MKTKSGVSGVGQLCLVARATSAIRLSGHGPWAGRGLCCTAVKGSEQSGADSTRPARGGKEKFAGERTREGPPPSISSFGERTRAGPPPTVSSFPEAGGLGWSAKKLPPGVVPLDSSWLAGLGPSPRSPPEGLGVSRALVLLAAGRGNPRLTLTEEGPPPHPPVPETSCRNSCGPGWLAEILPPVQDCKEEGVPCDSAAEQTKVSVTLAPADALLKAAEAPPPTSSLPDESLFGCWADLRPLPREPRGL